MLGTNKFQTLFRKYRLKAEFSTLSQLGLALAEKGLIYEDSIFSHWQKGDRIPNRPTILKLLQIFSERQSIRSPEEANEFLESAGQGYLTETEMEKIHLNSLEHVPFQVPNQIDNFTGRKVLIKGISKLISSNVLLIHGAAGVGKSVLAIRLGYLLKGKFPDGVLWYRLDTSDVMDILLSIAFAYGLDIGYIRDKEIRASTVRSILSEKKVLLIFDNAEAKSDIRLLLPNNKNCFVIITSQLTNISIPTQSASIFLETFTAKETLLLFKTILGHQYVIKNKSSILRLADKVGFLPLALHIFAKELKKGSTTITQLLEQIEEDSLSLAELSYGDKNLYLAINFSFELLDIKTKKIFLSLTVFNGKDFSEEVIAYINELSILQTRKLLDNLKSISLIEESTKTRFRIHLMIKKFLREKFDNPTLFIKAAKYYQHFLVKFNKTILKSYPNIKQESDNVLYIFKKCYEYQYWDEVIALWDPLETLLYATNQLNKMRYVYQIVKAQKTGINIFQKILIFYFCFLLTYWGLLNIIGLKTTFWNYLYFIYGLVPLIGGIIGFSIAKSWGFFKNSIGKAILFLSVGLVSWGMGIIIWAYYNFFLNNPVPYPSFADIGFIISYPLWTIGIVNLPHALGGKLNFGKKYRVILFFIPFLVFVTSYYLMVSITKNLLLFSLSTPLLKLFFDIAYPLGDVIILTSALAIGISFKFFGGKYKLSIYSILLAFVFMYIADFLFSYTTTAKSYYNGGIPDFFFTISVSLLTFGILGFHIKK